MCRYCELLPPVSPSSQPAVQAWPQSSWLLSFSPLLFLQATLALELSFVPPLSFTPSPLLVRLPTTTPPVGKVGYLSELLVDLVRKGNVILW